METPPPIIILASLQGELTPPPRMGKRDFLHTFRIHFQDRSLGNENCFKLLVLILELSFPTNSKLFGHHFVVLLAERNPSDTLLLILQSYEAFVD